MYENRDTNATQSSTYMTRRPAQSRYATRSCKEDWMAPSRFRPTPIPRTIVLEAGRFFRGVQGLVQYISTSLVVSIELIFLDSSSQSGSNSFESAGLLLALQRLCRYLRPLSICTVLPSNLERVSKPSLSFDTLRALCHSKGLAIYMFRLLKVCAV